MFFGEKALFGGRKVAFWGEKTGVFGEESQFFGEQLLFGVNLLFLRGEVALWRRSFGVKGNFWRRKNRVFGGGVREAITLGGRNHFLG